MWQQYVGMLRISVWTKRSGSEHVGLLRRMPSAAVKPKHLLADFVVGAHAALKADRLLTLDVKRYRTGFPDLKLLTV